MLLKKTDERSWSELGAGTYGVVVEHNDCKQLVVKGSLDYAPVDAILRRYPRTMMYYINDPSIGEFVLAALGYSILKEKTIATFPILSLVMCDKRPLMLMPRFDHTLSNLLIDPTFDNYNINFVYAMILHSCLVMSMSNIQHNDLKCANILLQDIATVFIDGVPATTYEYLSIDFMGIKIYFKTRLVKYIPKITDFGLSSSFNSDSPDEQLSNDLYGMHEVHHFPKSDTNVVLGIPMDKRIYYDTLFFSYSMYIYLNALQPAKKGKAIESIHQIRNGELFVTEALEWFVQNDNPEYKKYFVEMLNKPHLYLYKLPNFEYFEHRTPYDLSRKLFEKHNNSVVLENGTFEPLSSNGATIGKVAWW
jgi:serine/threonine protein kinase